MALLSERLANEIRDLRLVAHRSGGRITILSPGPTDKLVDRLVLELRYRTAPDAGYPDRVLSRTTLTLVLPSSYPHTAPKVSIKPIIFHPNVYSSGEFCAAPLWTGGSSLVTFLERILKVVVFDPSVINLASPANGSAARWYSEAAASHPTAFPSERLTLEGHHHRPKMVWHDK